jgi:AraC family transcriptional regulator
MKAALENYHARMQRVLDHIDQHLDGDLGLEALSGVAAFSKYHFHRQFMSTFGLSVHRYVQLARAGSIGRRNTGVKSLRWGFKLQGLTWPFV